MKLRTLLIIVIGLLGQYTAYPQAGEWTWVKGSTTVAPAGSFGTQGVEAASNEPPGFYEPCEWTDTAGNFWFFGGVDDTYENWGDLWKFNPLTNNWTWMKGTGVESSAGSFGTIGVPSLSNLPPARGWGVPTWVDHNGDLWLYGGYTSNGFLSDMWKYNIASNTFTWMQGSNTGSNPPSYGTMGVESASNSPGERYECDATWVDGAGDLWMYGGFNGSEPYADLWKYNITANQWTWMGGTAALGTAPQYGTLGVPAAGNNPGGRLVYCSWTDAGGNFWLYGGENGTEVFNDMWRYEQATGLWAWMAGTNVEDNNGNYGSLCVSDTGLESGARYENRARWKDDCGNFWFYDGGQGGQFETLYSDLWFFNPVSLQWTLVNGGSTTNVVPSYGAMGVAAASNTPGGRAGSIGWRSKTGDLYLFAGCVGAFISPYNDVWKFTINPACGNIGTPPTVNIGNDTNYCSAFSRVLSAGNAGAVWSTGYTGAQITVTQPGTYWASLTNGCGTASDTVRITESIVALQIDSVNTGCGQSKGKLTVFALSGTLPFQYLWNTGSTADTLTDLSVGTYDVTVTDHDGCSASISAKVDSSTAGTVSITAGNTSLCNGDSTLICASAGFANYLWSTGATTRCIYTLMAGDYYLTATAGNGCRALSNQVKITTAAGNVSISATDTSFCPGDSTLICASTGFVSYLWNTGDSTRCLYTQLAGNYYLTATASNGCVAFSNQIAINVLEAPPVTINISGDTLRAFDAVTYQWYFNGVPIPGDTTGLLVATKAGAYSVAVSDSNGCLIMSNDVDITGIAGLANDMTLKIYPDPVTDELNISYQLNSAANLQINFTDITGRCVASVLNEEESSGNYLQHINVRNLASAIYILKFTTESGSVNLRFVKE